MKLQDKKEKEILKKDDLKTKEKNTMESVIRQQNIKISHLLEKVETLQKDNMHMTLLLEEILYTISSKEDVILETENKTPELETNILQNLVKFN